jgi:hypothetical protein
MKPPVVTKEVLRLKLLQKTDSELRCILQYLQERSEYASQTTGLAIASLVEKILALDYDDNISN